jgi:hypothetical protein
MALLETRREVDQGGTSVTNVRDWFVAVQYNAVSLIDEGVDRVLDRFQKEARANAVMLTVYGFNPEIVERPLDHSDHGGKGRVGTAGGNFATPHPQYYAGVDLGDARVNESLFLGFDALAKTQEAAKKRGLQTHIYILESASTGGRQRTIAGWPRILEIDILGRKSALPCVNNPTYVAFKHALLEDLYKSYQFDGMLWGIERWGPFNIALSGAPASCFCEHCRAVARDHRLDWKRTAQGYRALYDANQRWRAEGRGSQTPFIDLLRLLLHYPEILAWERLWTEKHLALTSELYGIAKWLAPDRVFGVGLWHYYVSNPILRAEWDMKEIAKSADYIRPIVYHFPYPARFRLYAETLRQGALQSFTNGGIWDAFSQMLDLKLPAYDRLQSDGMPAEFVRQVVEIVRRDVGPDMPIYPGVGIDVRQQGFSRLMRPKDVVAAVMAAAKAGADGITASRNYAEMKIANLKAFGQALKELGR